MFLLCQDVGSFLFFFVLNCGASCGTCCAHGDLWLPWRLFIPIIRYLYPGALLGVNGLHGNRVKWLFCLIAHGCTHFDLVCRCHSLDGASKALLTRDRVCIIVVVRCLAEFGRSLARVWTLVRIWFIWHRLHCLSVMFRVIVYGSVIQEWAGGWLAWISVLTIFKLSHWLWYSTWFYFFKVGFLCDSYCLLFWAFIFILVKLIKVMISRRFSTVKHLCIPKFIELIIFRSWVALVGYLRFIDILKLSFNLLFQVCKRVKTIWKVLIFYLIWHIWCRLGRRLAKAPSVVDKELIFRNSLLTLFLCQQAIYVLLYSLRWHWSERLLGESRWLRMSFTLQLCIFLYSEHRLA